MPGCHSTGCTSRGRYQQQLNAAKSLEILDSGPHLPPSKTFEPQVFSKNTHRQTGRKGWLNDRAGDRSCAALWNKAGPSGIPSSCSSEVPPNSPPFDSRPVPGNADHASNTGCRRPIPGQIPPAPPCDHVGMFMHICWPLISAGTRCKPSFC